MNLSRAAKKFRTQIAREPEAPKPARANSAKTPPAPPPKKVWPVKAKRPRFVRAQVERRERSAAPTLPPRSAKLSARLLTRNLTLPPKDEIKLPR